MAILFNSGGNKFLISSAESNFDFNYNSPFSVSVWLYPTTTASYMEIIRKTGAGEVGWGLERNITTGAINFFLVNEYPANTLSKATDVAAPNNVWTHVTMTYDGSSTAAGVKFYFNGALVAATTGIIDTLTQSTLNDINPVLGIYDPLATQLFGYIGHMAEFRVYGRTLTANEAQTIYSCLGMDGIVSGLRSRWNMRELSSGSTVISVKDASGVSPCTPTSMPTYSDGITTSRRRAA